MKKLLRACLSCVAFVLPLLLASPPARAQKDRPHVTPDDVQRAVERAQDFLLREGDKLAPMANTIGGEEAHAGQTALVVYALVVSGIEPNDPRLAKAIEELKRAKLSFTYSLGLRSLLWAEMARTEKQLRAYVERDGRALVAGTKNSGVDGMYGYYVSDRTLFGMRYDHSCSNYGAMGAWAAAEAGYEVPDTYWRSVNAAWRDSQNADGSWGYTDDAPGTPSMTAGGIVTLFVSQQYIDKSPGGAARDLPRDKHIDAGIKWLAKHFEQLGQGAWPYYTIFNVQRVGLNSGYKYFDDLDWFQRVTDDLVRSQRADGAWGSGALDTAWALSFIALGRAPVAMNKLQYSTTKADAEGWNQRPWDVCKFAKWLSGETRTHFNWQIVKADMSIETLHDSPILYISGNRELKFGAKEREAFRRYVEEGGIIVGHANANSKRFAESFERLGQELFPQYAFRELPENHPIYADQKWPRDKWKRKPRPLRGLGNGSREFMLLFAAGDPARAWSSYRPSFEEDKSTLGKDEEFQIAGNVVLYSIERSKPRYKNESYIVEQRQDVEAQREIVLARLQYAGNWDPEPFGWAQLARRLHNEYATDLAAATVRLGDGQLDGRFPVAHLTGTGRLELDEQARGELRRYAYEGGVLIIDACGGTSEFAESAEAELQAIFDAPTKPLPLDHPLFRAAAQIAQVEYRQTARERLKADLDKPRLRCIERDGRIVAIFSPQDLSTGLVGHPVDGIVGYTPDDCARLMMNVLMYASRPR